MQADISYYASERNTYMNLLKQCYLSDTTETGMQQYLSLLNNESDIESKYELVFAKISNQDYEGALSSLATIEGMIDAEKQPEETDRLAKMNHIIPVLNSVESGNKTWETIEQSEKDYLIELSENDRSIVGSIATAARMQFEPNFVYEEPIYMPGEIPLKMAKPKKLNNSIINESTLKISPNPAVDYIEVSYDITGVINGLKMLITDAMGKTVLEKELTAAKDQQIIVVKDFAKGNYICTIYNNGKPNQNTKFIKK
jgi:hypothetical protein